MESNESQFFSASYDSTTKIISAVVFVVFVGVAAATGSAASVGLGTLIFILSYAYSPGGYAISGRSIIVKRLIGNVHIPLDGIREVRTATTDDYRGCLRLWGSGGLFGYYGLYRTSNLGKSTWYMTNRRDVVVVITGAKRVLFSPDDVDRFITAIHTSVPVPQVTPGGFLLDAMKSGGSGSSIGQTAPEPLIPRWPE